MLEIAIPGTGVLRLRHLVSDFTGTLSVGGVLLPGVRERLAKLASQLEVHILTADTFGSAERELRGLSCRIRILRGGDEDVQKEEYVKSLGAERVVAIGNGRNDRRMLGAAALGVAVLEGEGAAVDALLAADIAVRSATDALDLLLNPKRCRATLRF